MANTTRLANATTNITASGASAAPLRVALVNSFAGELPGSLVGQEFVELLANESKHLGELLSLAIEQLQQGLSVRLCFSPKRQSILMLPALTAAKLKCHPHAVWVGLGDNLESALSAAKRKPEDLSLELNDENIELNSDNLSEDNTIAQQLSRLSALIAALHSRDLSTINSASPRSSNYWFTPPHKARVASFQFASGQLESNTAKTLILTQGTAQAEAKPLIDEQRLLFIISGKNQVEMTRSLEGLDSELNNLTAEREHLNPSEHTEKCSL